MKQHRWQFAALAFGLLGMGSPAMAQFTGPPTIPRPIAEFFPPGVGRHISTLDHFSGIVAVALIQGTGKDDKGNTHEFELDVRAMQGVYITPDGTSQRGTFCFT